MITPLALFALPALVGSLLCVAGRRAERFAAPAGVTAAAITLLMAVDVSIERTSSTVPFLPGAPVALSVDGLSAAVVLTVTGVTVLVLVFAAGDSPGAPARFHGVMLLFAAAVVVTATATTLLTLLAAWEVMGATSYALIGFWWRDPPRLDAAATSFVTTRSADLGLYAAAAAALAGGSGFAFTALPRAAGGWQDVVAAGVLVAGLGKAAQLPFSFWLSRAMQGPSPVSALLHSAAMVAMGGYLLLRLAPVLAATGWAATVAAWAGAATAVALGLVALAQRDLKQLLAASTAAQLGFVVAAAGLGAVAGGAAQLVGHAATKALLFLAAGAWLTAVGSKQLPALRGAARRWPVAGAAAAVGLLSLAGVPPLALWATKDQVLATARESSPGVYVALLVAAGLSAAYAAKALVQVLRDPAGSTPDDADRHAGGTGRVGPLETIPLVVLAVAAAGLGLLALPAVGDPWRRGLGRAGEPAAGAGELAASALLTVVVTALLAAWSRAGRRPLPGRMAVLGTWLHGWLGLEPLAHRLVVRPVLRAATALDRFDSTVLDRAVAAAGAAVRASARVASVVDARALTRTVLALGRGVRRAGEPVRAIQSGQLYAYYLIAVPVLAGSVLLLVVVR